MSVKYIAILASGSGSNAENIVRFFKKDPEIKVRSIFSNKKDAYVLERAKNMGIPSASFTKEEFHSEDFLKNFENIDLIVLAGFLWLVPAYLLKAFPNKIINIHPALLPKYGGKGMYGMAVHKAVVENKEQESGISIHYVNEKYDEGNIIFQARCKLEEHDLPEDVAAKVHKLEYEHFPVVIRDLLL